MFAWEVNAWPRLDSRDGLESYDGEEQGRSRARRSVLWQPSFDYGFHRRADGMSITNLGRRLTRTHASTSCQDSSMDTPFPFIGARYSEYLSCLSSGGRYKTNHSLHATHQAE